MSVIFTPIKDNNSRTCTGNCYICEDERPQGCCTARRMLMVWNAAGRLKRAGVHKSCCHGSQDYLHHLCPPVTYPSTILSFPMLSSSHNLNIVHMWSPIGGLFWPGITMHFDWLYPFSTVNDLLKGHPLHKWNTPWLQQTHPFNCNTTKTIEQLQQISIYLTGMLYCLGHVKNNRYKGNIT